VINPPTTARIRLSPRVFRIAELTAEGYRTAEIARLVGTTDLTIKNYRQRIYDETGMSTQLELALWWRQYGSTVEALDRRFKLPEATGTSPEVVQEECSGPDPQPRMFKNGERKDGLRYRMKKSRHSTIRV